MDVVFRKLKEVVFWAVGLCILSKFCVAHPGYLAQGSITKLKLPAWKLQVTVCFSGGFGKRLIEKCYSRMLSGRKFFSFRLIDWVIWQLFMQ